MKGILAVAAMLAFSVPAVVVAGEGRPDRGNQEQGAQQQGGGNEDANRKDQQGRRGGRGEQQGGRGTSNSTPPAQSSPPAQDQRARRGNLQVQNPVPRPEEAPQGSVRARGNNNRNANNLNTDNRNENDNRRDAQPRAAEQRALENQQGDNNRRVDNNRGFNSDGRAVVGRNLGYQRDPKSGRNFRFRGQSFVSVRAPGFAYPRGYGYRRWAIGASLPLLFLSEPYYVDWGYIGLARPEPGEEWVRYGPDAVLVDTDSGEVIDVAYGVFY